MAWMDPLTANLLDLLFELRELPVPLTIGGGFGLYLKRVRLDETRERTLFSQLPMPRATNDLDLFVRADVLCDLQSMKAVAAALDRLGYEVVPEAKYMHVIDSIPGAIAARIPCHLACRGVRASARSGLGTRPLRSLQPAGRRWA